MNPAMSAICSTLPIRGKRLDRGRVPWLARLLCFAILTLAALPVNPGTTPAQTKPRDAFAGTLFSAGPKLFANDGRIKLLVLALNPFGITETAAEQIGLILQKNLNNTGHFSVVGPRETNTAFETSNPDLVDCREIACGVESGKRLGADFVLVGTLRLREPDFVMEVRVIDSSNNLTDYEEQSRFQDNSMDEELFQLANNISRNSLIGGRVLNTSIRGIVISLGKTHGLKLGDHMVIYKKEVPITNLEGERLDVQRKNVAIVKVLNVNENTSEAILVHRTEEPQVGQFAHTYLNPRRQIEFIENARKELDTGIRLANRIRPLELAPTLLADSEKKKWLERKRRVEVSKDFWQTGLIIGGVATVFVLNGFDNDSSGRIQLGLAGGVLGYSLFKWWGDRKELESLQVEGRSKGFVGWQLNPIVNPERVGLELALRF